MKKLIPFLLIFSVVFIFGSFSSDEDNFTVGKDTPVWQVLEYLGEPAPPHAIEDRDKEMIRMGKELILDGTTKGPKGKKAKLQSKHFKCISCHNLVKEDPDLSVSDPQERLVYAKENNLPFLQGTTLYGIVNRMSYYNGDYQKKYDGNPRIIKSHKDLREAVQLCAVECAQGRPMKKWELDAILTYLWSLELKMGDLNLNDDDFAKIRAAGDGSNSNEIKELIHSKYLDASPATFSLTPKDAKEGFPGITGNPENGRLVYDLSCLHCHEEKIYSMYELDNNKMTFQHLKRHIPRYDRYSIYQVSRYGAPSSPGKRAYMPQYPLEKLSDQQLEDLRAYVDERAK